MVRVPIRRRRFADPATFVLTLAGNLPVHFCVAALGSSAARQSSSVNPTFTVTCQCATLLS